jgi:hypothetical protein
MNESKGRAVGDLSKVFSGTKNIIAVMGYARTGKTALCARLVAGTFVRDYFRTRRPETFLLSMARPCEGGLEGDNSSDETSKRFSHKAMAQNAMIDEAASAPPTAMSNEELTADAGETTSPLPDVADDTPQAQTSGQTDDTSISTHHRPAAECILSSSQSSHKSSPKIDEWSMAPFKSHQYTDFSTSRRRNTSGTSNFARTQHFTIALRDDIGQDTSVVAAGGPDWSLVRGVGQGTPRAYIIVCDACLLESLRRAYNLLMHIRAARHGPSGSAAAGLGRAANGGASKLRPIVLFVNKLDIPRMGQAAGDVASSLERLVALTREQSFNAVLCYGSVKLSYCTFDPGRLALSDRDLAARMLRLAPRTRGGTVGGGAAGALGLREDRRLLRSMIYWILSTEHLGRRLFDVEDGVYTNETLDAQRRQFGYDGDKTAERQWQKAIEGRRVERERAIEARIRADRVEMKRKARILRAKRKAQREMDEAKSLNNAKRKGGCEGDCALM